MMNKGLTTLLFSILIIVITSFSLVQRGFKGDQKRFPRVRTAYSEKLDLINRELSEKGLTTDRIEVYIRVFKFEKELELWGRNQGDDEFKKIKSYDVCSTSGKLGPKRKQGDLQIPEGFYHIDRFNPSSNFYLSMGINYPNRSDRILGVKNNLGGDIFIHGACVTIGCVPITDDLIKELYVYCVEAKNNGQQIPVTIFPAKMTNEKYALMQEEFRGKNDHLTLWKSLKKGYDYFNSSHKLPNIQFMTDGGYNVLKND